MRFPAAFAAAVAAAIIAPAAPAQQPRGTVYALCTVRDVTLQGDQVVGKVYRSAIFSVAANYERDVSLTPENGEIVSGAFEQWVNERHGLRSDRVGISEGDEHYCIEAPATAEGHQTLVRLVQEWNTQPNSGVEHVLTGWYPEGLGKRIGHLKPPSAEEQPRYRAAVQKRESDIAAMEASHRKAAAAAQQALDQHATEAARARAAQEQYERDRQAYREEYRRLTGRYPDE